MDIGQIENNFKFKNFRFFQQFTQPSLIKGTIGIFFKERRLEMLSQFVKSERTQICELLDFLIENVFDKFGDRTYSWHPHRYQVCPSPS